MASTIVTTDLNKAIYRRFIKEVFKLNTTPSNRRHYNPNRN
ncbi:MAG TPA: hypothetical protein VHZ07_23545 [Bryobacteraceae bacterium]|jgi:hypothetical protein|nr:hypothetical protein [Bryobacteraceae bacterium]